MRFLLLTLGLVLTMAMGSRRPVPEPAPLPQKPAEEVSKPATPTETPAPGTVLVTAKIIGKSTDAARIAKLDRLTPAVQRILNSPEFEARMLKAWWNGKAGFQDTSDTPAQVLAKLKSSPWEQVYEFALQRNWRGACPVLGWTYPNTKTVWFNTCNFDDRDDCGLVGTRFHEETHKRGYDHASAKRLLSVPYYTGTQAALICEDMKKKGEL